MRSTRRCAGARRRRRRRASRARRARSSSCSSASGDDVRQCCCSASAPATTTDWEKAGGALTARLLTSGATAIAVDLAGARRAPPCARGRALRRRGGAARLALRRLSHQAARQAEADADDDRPSPARADGHRGRLGGAGGGDRRASTLTRDAGHRAAQHHLSRKLRRTLPPTSRASALEIDRARRGRDGRARHGRAARRQPGLGARGAAAGAAWNGGGAGDPAARASSARA